MGFRRSAQVGICPDVPGPVAAVFEKELRYLSRSGPMLFTLIVPLFMLAVFRSSGKNEGLFAHAPELTFPLGAAYSLLLLTNLSYNNFGADGGGTQFFFASPVRFRQIMLGKNLAHAAVFALEVVLVWLGTCLLYRPPSLGVTLATLAGILFVVPIDLAAGNLFSIYSPSRIEAGVFGRQRASLTTVLASFAIRGALFGVGALMLWFSRDIWKFLGGTADLFAAGCVRLRGLRFCSGAGRWNCPESQGKSHFQSRPPRVGAFSGLPLRLGLALWPCRLSSGSAMKR